MANELKVQERTLATTMGSLPREGEIEIWNKVLSSRGTPIPKDFWKVSEFESLELGDLILYQIEEITYEEDAPQLEALENALSCMTVSGMNLVYLILGEKGRVSFYFGVARDYLAPNEGASVKEIGDAFLKPALEGNFRGSIVRELDDPMVKKGVVEKSAILKTLKGYLSKPENCRVLSGVPGGVKDKENRDFRGIDRLVDIMQGDSFGLMILAKPIEPRALAELRTTIFKAYEMVSAASKQSVQIGMNEGQSRNLSVNIGKSISTSQTHTTGTNTNESRTSGSSTNEKRSEHSRFTDGTSTNKTVGGGKSTSDSKAKTLSENTGKSESEGQNRGSSLTVSSDLTNKIAADWVKYFDDVVVPRLDYARGKGAYVVNTTLFGENPNVVRKLAQAARSIFAGEMANMVPLLAREPSKDECAQLQNLTIPYHPTTSQESAVMPYAESGLMAYAGNAYVQHVDNPPLEEVLYAGNWMSVRELAQMAGLPQKEVVGLRLKEEVEFGLNVPLCPESAETSVNLGTLVKSGSLAKGCEVVLDGAQLDRHVFVAGVTGSGKTTTCQTLLLSSGWPFLVIEPAKTEYRGLKNAEKAEIREQCKDLLVFTLGDDTVAPFRLNPFELIPGESVTARVDMLMASITAAFDMEAAIPQLIERAIYACYEECGWSVDDNTNARFEDPFADGVFAFPTLSDVLRMTEKVVDEQGFDDRLKRDYIGSIKARLQGLTLGAKGFMLDCPRSIDFMKLLDRKVVLELEPIPNAAQKSLIIGFVLTNLLQAVKRKFQTTNAKVNHITLIEEAHRLLSKPEPGGSPSQKQAAETFADMLAEIRKYGESLVIADQIPGKLTPEVMKNTNTKIIHRLFAQDDKEAVGHTMGLEEDQAKFLSNLAVGRAVVFNGNWPKAIQVQISQTFRTDAKIPKDENKILRSGALAFYAEDYKRGVFGMSHLLTKKPSEADLEANVKKERELTKLFRTAGGVTATSYSPILVATLVENFGEKAFRSVLNDAAAIQELAEVFDGKDACDLKCCALNGSALTALVKAQGEKAVWYVLASRIWPYGKVEKRLVLFESFLKTLAAITKPKFSDNGNDVVNPIKAARKALIK